MPRKNRNNRRPQTPKPRTTRDTTADTRARELAAFLSSDATFGITYAANQRAIAADYSRVTMLDGAGC
jgi:hypothetical protein